MGQLEKIKKNDLVRFKIGSATHQGKFVGKVGERFLVQDARNYVHNIGKVEKIHSSSTPEKTVSDKPLSLINAAHKVLKEEGRTMSCPEMVDAAITKGYWKKGVGKTPAQTLYAAILREIKMSNERFKRSEVGGKFRVGS